MMLTGDTAAESSLSTVFLLSYPAPSHRLYNSTQLLVFGFDWSAMVLAFDIPSDVIYTIIRELREDIIALRRCSLVSHSFLPYTRQYLFTTIKLDHPKQCRALHEVLSNNPGLTSYIHNLCLVTSALPELPNRDWVAVENTLPEILQMLPRLRSFTFRSLLLGWDSLPNGLQSAFLGLSTSPITTIIFENFRNLPIAQFTRFIHLTKLRWNNVLVEEKHILSTRQELSSLTTASLSYPMPRGTGYLELLDIRHSAESGRLLVDALNHPLSSLSITRLRELFLHGNCRFAGDIVNAASSSLERFIWTKLGEAHEGM
jgi:hypothetical protein